MSRVARCIDNGSVEGFLGIVFKVRHNADKLYISVSLENMVVRRIYAFIGFTEIKEVEYNFLEEHFREM